ncbi:hypothetical protein TNIN_133511 [Trichonephila inaurata madagascariensis]|uniref:Endonuclease/exonuclease/phosphatase domain-containing protein n=1 Tax=Trichonephila inaurata madagascariensis TaxID=2747483 RepID=A0A8X6YM20_9ARAC|nr:hypothetical protein TNIN_133511 [Trichonephila inaurata madagascariensis]
MLEHIANNPNLLESVVACNETWIFTYDSESKVQSMQWKSPGSPKPKKARMSESKFKAFIFLNDGSPTHTSFSYGTSDVLDVSFVSPGLFSHCDWTVLDSIGSDHLPILIKVHIKSRTVAASRNFWNFKKADWEDFVSLMSSTPRGSFRRLKSFIQHRNPELRNLILRRNDLHRTLSRTSDPKVKIEFKRLNVAIKQLYINHKRKTWINLCSNIDASAPNSKLW